MHISGFHGRVSKVQKALGSSIPVTDTPDGSRVGRIVASDGVSRHRSAGSDGDSAGVNFEFLHDQISIIYRLQGHKFRLTPLYTVKV